MHWFKRDGDVSIAERVKYGVAVLDDAKPGWHRGISLHSLDIANGTRCALGQTYGTYEWGRETLRISRQKAVDCGFQASSLRIPTARGDEFEALTIEWRRQIEERLDAERAEWAKQQEKVPFRRKVGAYVRW